jgi:hypothetical protein
MITTRAPWRRTLLMEIPLLASSAINMGTYGRVARLLKRISVAAVVLASVGQAHAQDTKPVTNTQIALFVTVCIRTAAHGGLCQEFQLTPGVAGSLFSSVQACDAGTQAAMEKWFKDVNPMLGITEKNVFARRCGPPEVAINPERQASVEGCNRLREGDL